MNHRKQRPLAITFRFVLCVAATWLGSQATSVHAQLSANWKLNETSGTVANDSSGNNKHGTLVYMDPATDWIETALDFDGNNDRVTTPVTVGKTFTWVAWFNLRTQSGYDSILAIPNTGVATDTSYMLMDVYGSNGSFWANDGMAGSNLGVTGLQVDTWYHLAFVREGDSTTGGYKAYLNGVFTGSKNTGIWSSADAIYVGGRSGVPSQHFDGRIAEVYVYDNALSAAQIAALYTATARPGLVSHWKLDESSGTIASDSAPAGNDGTLSSLFSFDSESVESCPNSSTALDFNGTDDYISVPNDASLQITAALTATAWIKAVSWGSGYDVGTIIRKGEGNPLNYAFSIVNGKVALVLNGSDGASYTGDSVLEIDTWYHVAATWDGSEIKLFVNGRIDHASPIAYSTTIGTDTRALYIGGRAATDLFDGVVDDVRLYNLALSEKEIAILYGLVGHWKFDETSGTTAADAAPIGNDGNLENDPTWTPGRVAGSIEFDGLTNYVRVPNDTSLDLTDSLTFSAWIKANATQSFGFGTMLTKNKEASAHSYYWVFGNGGANPQKLNVYLGGLSTPGWHPSTSDVPTGKWAHVATTYHNGVISHFINGVLDNQITGLTGSILVTSNELTIGQRKDTLDSWLQYSGGMDDLKIFNRALCAEEIELIFSSGKPKGVRVLSWKEVK